VVVVVGVCELVEVLALQDSGELGSYQELDGHHGLTVDRLALLEHPCLSLVVPKDGQNQI
jgi:hypothetical protein